VGCVAQVAIQGRKQALAMKKSELNSHKMLWFKDTIQVRWCEKILSNI